MSGHRKSQRSEKLQPEYELPSGERLKLMALQGLAIAEAANRPVAPGRLPGSPQPAEPPKPQLPLEPMESPGPGWFPPDP